LTFLKIGLINLLFESLKSWYPCHFLFYYFSFPFHFQTPERTKITAPVGHSTNFFIFILSWFSKNKWSNQNFRQMYIWRRGPRWQAPAAVAQGVKSLAPWGMAAGVRFLRQGGAARREDPAAEPLDGRSVPSCHTAAGSFLFFLVFGF
jgi:hypothetical protein